MALSYEKFRRYTPAEYLALEEAASYRSEYYDGLIVMMAGSSENHDFIQGNLYADMNLAFRGTPCRAYTSNMKVQVEYNSQLFFTYPDVSALCGERKLGAGGSDILINPSLIIEVLSPSTAHYDRTDKFELYKSLPSLQQYVLIEQKRVYVEVFTRQSDGDWLLHSYHDIEAILKLEVVNFETPLANVYNNVVFPKRRKQSALRPRIIK